MEEFMKTMIFAIIGSNALFSFAQFIVTRSDNKKNIEKKIETGFCEVKSEVQVVSDRLEEHKAILARTHILRFADELRQGTHSREYFEQQLQDIDTYDRYCDENPNFANNRTRMASEFIREQYRIHYLNHDDQAV